MTKEFYVHTELLNDVANEIQSLLDKIGAPDATPGTYARFREAASITQPTATFWDGPNALATAYDQEYKYVCASYEELVNQLNYVKSACAATAAKYAHHEANAKHDVTSSEPTFGS